MAASSNQPSKTTIAAIGDALREAREKKSLTIDQVQKQTHIHSTVIKALEEGRCDDILNGAYVKSFLKKYSDHLGLDSRKILDEYRALHPSSERTDARTPKTASPAETESGPDLSGILPALKLVTVAAVVLFILVFVGGRIITHFKKTKPAKAETQLKTAAHAKTAKTSKKKASQKKDGSQISIPKNVPLKLLLKVNRDVLVKLKVDGNLLFGKVLPKGTTEEFTAKSSINIFVAKGEYVELVLNGRPLGSPGKGVLDNIEITRNGLKVK